MQRDNSDSMELKALKNQIEGLQQRVAHIEKLMSLSGIGQSALNALNSEDTDIDVKFPFPKKGSIEFGVGEIGMAWVGNVILFFGITFLVAYLQKNGNPVLPILAGFAFVGIMYAGARISKNSYSFLSKLLTYNGHLLLFYVTVQLHFFQNNPLLKNSTFAIFCVFLVVAFIMFRAIKTKSSIVSAIGLLLLIAAGAIYNSTVVMAITATLAVVISVYLYYRFGWLKLTFFFIFCAYLAHFNWMLNNPFLGNKPGFIESLGIGYLFFIGTGFIVSLLALIPKKENISNEFLITAVVWNGLGFSFVLALVVFTYFAKSYVPIFTSIALFCLIYSFILQKKSDIQISASMYVLYGFLATSVAIFGVFNLPKSYLFFALQSLLVVSVALWFRSRFIIIMNAILFPSFLIFYLINPQINNSTNISFMVVAFLSARIINWKRERLNIKTEFIRNIYLIIGLFTALLTFYYISPAPYITASWILVAIILFVLSLLLKNKKYRWLAISVVVIAALRLVFIDMKTVDIGYRVLVFMALAILSIAVSVLYTRFFDKN